MRSNWALYRAVLGGLALAIALTVPAVGQQPVGGAGSSSPGASAIRTLPDGVAAKVEGIIVSTEAGTLRLKDNGGSEVNVVMTGQTQIKEKKSNPFRGSTKYGAEQLVKGLVVEAKGKGNASGALVADEVRFTQDDLKFAQSLHTRVAPVEARLTDTEGRLQRTEQEAHHMAGQIDELAAVSNAARGGAKAAQETADAAQTSANAAQRTADQATTGVHAANERISSLDDFDVRDSGTVRFKAGSSILTHEAQAELERLATQVKTLSGYVIEVTGYASSDGNESFNVQLSERRANVVVRYLVEQQGVPLRRVVTPFGFGEKHPVADNATREGRTQNRRVDVRILVSKGLVQKTTTTNASLQSNVN
jgi:OmpA-OmpF porin, OOP family